MSIFPDEVPQIPKKQLVFKLLSFDILKSIEVANGGVKHYGLWRDAYGHEQEVPIWVGGWKRGIDPRLQAFYRVNIVRDPKWGDSLEILCRCKNFEGEEIPFVLDGEEPDTPFEAKELDHYYTPTQMWIAVKAKVDDVKNKQIAWLACLKAAAEAVETCDAEMVIETAVKFFAAFQKATTEEPK